MLLCKQIHGCTWQPNQLHPDQQNQAAPYQCSSSGIHKLFINKVNFSNVFASQTAYTNPLQTSCLKQFSSHCCCEYLLFCNGNRSPALEQYILFLSTGESSFPGSQAAFWHKKYTVCTYTCALKPPEVCTFITKTTYSHKEKKAQTQNGESYQKYNNIKTTKLDETNSLFGPGFPWPNARDGSFTESGRAA